MPPDPTDIPTDTPADIRISHQPGPDRPDRPGRLRAAAETIGLVPPKAGADPYAHRRGEPRAFAVLWLSYVMIASAAVYAGVGSPVFASPDGYRLASKVLMTVIAAGVCTFWPMVRLSQARPPGRVLPGTIRDLVIVLVPVQAFYWPQALLTGWGVEAVGAAALVLSAWAVGVAACLVAAFRLPPLRSSQTDAPHAGVRAAWMAVPLFAMLVAPAVLGGLAGHTGAEPQIDRVNVVAMTSPLTAHWELLADRDWTGQQTRLSGGHWRSIGVTWGTCLSLWAAVLLCTRPGARRGDVGR